MFFQLADVFDVFKVILDLQDVSMSVTQYHDLYKVYLNG